MYRIDNATSVPHASGVPTPAAPGSNVNGYFTGGNPGGGVPATIVDADWANATQEEIANAIEGAGITLDKTNRSQLLASILALQKTTGQCRLSVTSTTVLTLSPFNGNNIRVNGTNVVLPSAGITITNSGLVTLTLYYVYVYLSAGTPTLELSATGHATSTVDGTEIKSGDGTRAFVGMVYMGAGTPGTFVDSVGFRGLANWYNRRGHVLGGASTSGATTASLTPVELTSAARVTSLFWGDEDCELRVIGTASNGTGADGFAALVGVDGTYQGFTSSGYSATGGLGSGTHGIFCAPISEGAHVVSPFGEASIGGTATFNVNVLCLVRI